MGLNKKTAWGRQWPHSLQFAADAAHELRTPLAILISEAQTTLARERTAAEYRAALEAGLDIAQQMRRLTESLLQLAQSDANSQSIARKSVDVSEVARACVERSGQLAAQYGVRIRTDLSAAVACSMPERVERVIANILTNAIVYNKPSGEIRIATFSNADSAAVRVTDTGIGIAAADLRHVFDRFYRVEKSRSRGQGHAGLGLAICQATVEADEGTIEVASTPGTGTTFTVRWPSLVRSGTSRRG
jgi:signal transduction histidine kinase